MTDAFALDFDSYNQANIAFRDGLMLRYATKSILTGNQWVFSSYEDVPFIGSGQLDMALAVTGYGRAVRIKGIEALFCPE